MSGAELASSPAASSFPAADLHGLLTVQDKVLHMELSPIVHTPIHGAEEEGW